MIDQDIAHVDTVAGILASVDWSVALKLIAKGSPEPCLWRVFDDRITQRWISGRGAGVVSPPPKRYFHRLDMVLMKGRWFLGIQDLVKSGRTLLFRYRYMLDVWQIRQLRSCMSHSLPFNERMSYYIISNPEDGIVGMPSTNHFS
jgi:hypothetical protein